MRILVDLQGLQNQSRHRGIGRYVANLARGLLRNRGRHEIRFLLNAAYAEHVEPIISMFDGLADRDDFFIFKVPGPTAALHVENEWRASVSHILYQQLVHNLKVDSLLIGSLFEGGADDVVVTTGQQPRSHLVASVLYDLIPLLNPDQHISSSRAKKWYFGKVDDARSADLLLGISHSACLEGLNHLPSDAGQVRYIGAAAGEEFADSDYRRFRGHPVAVEVLAFHSITRPYIMHTSALDPRKNFEGLIAAFAKLPKHIRTQHQLVLVCGLRNGGESRLQAAISKAGLDDDEVILTDFVEDNELRILYANAKLFVFPSYHEGFGLPVLEAMWCGTPAVGSCLSSVPEVIGRDDALFDPYDVAQMASVIGDALSNERRNVLLSHAAKHVAGFSWDLVAQRALEALEEKHAGRQNVDAKALTAPEVIALIKKVTECGVPSDDDLLKTAIAMAENEKLVWPRANPLEQTVCERLSPPQGGTQES